MSRFIALLVLGCIGIAAGSVGARPATELTPVSPGGDAAAPLEEIARSLAGAALVESTSLPVKATGGAGTTRLSDHSDL